MQLKVISISFAILSSLTYVAFGAPVQSPSSGYVSRPQNRRQGHLPKPTGEHFHPTPDKEAHNTHQAGQLLGHGYDAHTNTHYLVMKHMGKSSEKHGVPAHDIQHLNDAANARYAANHGLRNK
ncbi:hypothetical protein B0H34DRAFT_810487 [Crassisporium funariophilum]|nr:hypothetical protein B0H34DRAFT_810487 [Crassisporium funariophilum]